MPHTPTLRSKHFKKSNKPGKLAFTESKLAVSDKEPIYNLVGSFQKYLHLPNPDALYALMGAVAANMMNGNDPVWLMLVGASGSGKTCMLKSLSKLDRMHPIGDIDSKAAFLSGVKKKEMAAGSKGGLLHDIGPRGAVVWYEFTAVLELPRDSLKAILTALRQIFDGYYSRNVGTDGSKKLEWRGRLAAFGGVTNAIDTAHQFSATMGERFVFYRLPVTDGWGESYKALEEEDNEEMAEELSEAVANFFYLLGMTWDGEDGRPLEQQENTKLIALAQFATKARSGVERDNHNRDIINVPQAEQPMRCVKSFRRLYLGMLRIGVDEEDRWRVLRKIAMDSMPLTRRTALEAIIAGKRTMGEIGAIMQVSNSTVERTLQDLKVHGVVRKIPPLARTGDADEDDVEVKSKGWELTPWTVDKLEQVGAELKKK